MDVLDHVVSVLLLVVVVVPPFILFHTSKTLIDLVEGPDVEVYSSTFKLLVLVKKIHRDTTDSELVALFEYKDYVDGESSLNWQLTIP